MWALITSRLAGPIAAAVAALLFVLLTVQTVRIEGAPFFGGGYKAEVAALHASINDPNTGYVVTLERARANGLQFQTAANTCNAHVRDLEAEGARKTAEAQAAIQKARGDLVAANRRVATFMANAARLPGEDECTAARRAADEVNE